MPDLATGNYNVWAVGTFGPIQSSVDMVIESQLDTSGISPAQDGQNGGSLVTTGFDENTVVAV